MTDLYAGAPDMASSAGKPVSEGPRSITNRWNWFRALFVVFLVLSIAMTASNLHAAILVPLLYETSVPDPFLITQAYIVDYGQAGFSIAYLVSYFACAIAYACFMARSIHNARLRYPNQVNITPHGYWLWHIVPIASLFKPVNGMVETWHALHAGGDGPTTPLIPLWWSLWVIGSFLGVANRLFPASHLDFVLSPGNVDSYVNFQIYSSVQSVVVGLCAFFLLRLVGQLKELQMTPPEDVFS